MANWNEQKAAIVFECIRGVKFLEEPKSMDWGTFVRFQKLDGNEYLLKG